MIHRSQTSHANADPIDPSQADTHRVELDISERTAACSSGGLSALTMPILHHHFEPESIYNPNGERGRMVAQLRPGVLTPESAEFAGALKLHESIDCAVTKLGSAALLRDILHPLQTVRGIYERRAAIAELQQNLVLREHLENALQATKRPFLRGMSVENCALLVRAPKLADQSRKQIGLLHGLVDRALGLINPSRDMPNRLKSFSAMLEPFKGCPTATSSIIRACLTAIDDATRSPDCDLFCGKAIVQGTTVTTRNRTSWYVPTFSINGSFINIEEQSMVSTMALAVAAGIATHTAGTGVQAYELLGVGLWWLAAGAVAMTWARSLMVNQKTQLKLQERANKAEHLDQALDAIGELDALLSLAKFQEREGEKLCMPKLRSKLWFQASYTGMKNPTIEMSEGCVANDIQMTPGRVVMLSGPNSGGKSALATAIVQNQILAQIGAPVFATRAELSVADHILYQGPIFKSLGRHGKFGTELEATKNLFTLATGRSLVVIDEVGDGTTRKEGNRQIVAVLRGFAARRVGTLLVTHNSAVVKRGEDLKRGDAFQMEAKDGVPTFRLVPGISTRSNAEQVAAQISFTPEHIRAYVKEMLARERVERRKRHSGENDHSPRSL